MKSSSIDGDFSKIECNDKMYLYSRFVGYARVSSIFDGSKFPCSTVMVLYYSHSLPQLILLYDVDTFSKAWSIIIIIGWFSHSIHILHLWSLFTIKRPMFTLFIMEFCIDRLLIS